MDHALMNRARVTGESVVRVYSWRTPVLSLGRNQRAVGAYLDVELERRGIGVVRRPTGGRALLHHREITYSVTAPVASGSLSDSYRRINSLLMKALHALGVPVSIASPTDRERSPDGMPCFAKPSAGELVSENAKLVGSAQWRDGGAFLQHGSIIVDDDQSLIPLLMREPAPAAAPASLRQQLGRAPSAGEFAEVLFEAVRSSEDSNASILEGSDLAELDVERELARYRDPAWTWRR